MIHDYFLAKTIDQLRPGGGVAALITTKGTIDKASPEDAIFGRRARLAGGNPKKCKQ